MKTILKTWSKFEIVWLSLFTISGVVLSFVWESSWLSFISFVTGILCVVLVAKGSIVNYPIGLVQSTTYGILSLQSLLYGEAILNLLYFTPVQIVGWVLWSKHMDTEKKEVRKRKLSKKEIIFWGLGTLAFVILYNQILIWMGSALPIYNSMTTSLSVIAMLLMVIRSRYQWLIWAIVNIISIAMWIQTKDFLMAMLFAAYLTNNIYGWSKWRNN